MDNDEAEVQINFDERSVRAISSAVEFTLEKWTGQGYMDQEQLLALKPFLRGCIMEFDFHR